MSNQPLAGVRVLELARILAGPWAGQLMADLGADVIKVERPDAGDDTRHWGPPFLQGEDGAFLDAAYFHACNRGKRSIAIDITTAEGQAEVRALAASSDVVLENYKVGGLAKYGLDHAALSQVNPRIITCSITGFGQTGPYAERAGYDFIIQAMGGAMSLTGEPDGAPQKAGVAYADIFTGLYSTVAVLAALHQRQATGNGAHIDMALLDCQVGVLANQALNLMATGRAPKRLGNGHPNLVPYQAFASLDGDLIIAVGSDHQFAKLCAILGMEGLAHDERYSANAARVANREELIDLLSGMIRLWPRDLLFARLEEASVPAGPINTLDAVFEDPQVRARGMALRPTGPHGPTPGLACPIVMDGERQASTRSAPRLDQDGDAIRHLLRH